MFIEFRVENHRSIREEQALTFEASNIGADDDPVVRSVESLKLLPSLALYGGNASGKSNLLSALGFFRDAVTLSHRLWAPEGGVPRDPFVWGGGVGEPSTFEITLLVGSTRVQYGFVADDQRFVEEWIYAWPKGRKQTWFERDGDKLSFGEHLLGPNKVIEQVLRPNALFLSTATQLGHEQLAPLSRALSNIRTFDLGGRLGRDTRLAELLVHQELSKVGQATPGSETSAGWLQGFRELLRAADTGIVDLRLASEEAEGGPRGRARRARLFLQHQRDDEDAWLPLEAESGGTRTLVSLAPHLLGVLRQGGLLVMDELGADLHTLLVLHILRHFSDPQLNPKNAQLLFATHDTNLLGTTLGEPALRRDQVWLTEKCPKGATHVYPLTDYKPRKGENLERGYLQGRYGAIPILGAFVFEGD
ncbi:ATP-binding protein [Myxococcota bacterium]|nr:ATP-binding protein [Myxococcota bacterium]